ncbi:sugar ABC transporter ATP-binding protein [Streptomyces sp. NPDC001812]|uniref:Sugar ABC transporter ATP-binding protein n=1 Tax=Streptomyces cathayae TaxID=3031124 RepID=A0ABY8JVH8_9ACTN|nr:sugar ABC transporter ATP-binding protein [Streptomyces sp. HUAS 5]WGD39657.1 sugar ABC transporter ATP-binding protein [Streptomyces sp. HUAS 5]
MTEARLQATNVCKTFGHSKVLKGVELDVRPGELHALVGQNGSGKSTLVKILTGYHQPDPGMTLTVDGNPQRVPVRWAELQQAGVSVVHQDLGILDHLTVAENIGVGRFTRSKYLRRIDWRQQEAVARSVLGRLDVPVDVRTPVGRLSATRRAEVGIARAMRDLQPGTGLIILDEATRALPREELRKFHELLRRVVDSGTSVLMISHNLHEVIDHSDRVTVLRDGSLAAAGRETRDLSERDIARLMLGQHVPEAEAREPHVPSGKVALEVQSLTTPSITNLDFTVEAGEVVGLTGLPGSGFEHVPYVLGGSTKAVAGRVVTGGSVLDAARMSVSGSRRAGIALVPERRDRDGLALEMSIRDNLALPNLVSRGRRWWVSREWQDELADQAITSFGIRTPSARTTVKELSGGNQQKVLFAKWMSVGPKVLVLHEPTQAVDVGARAEILRAVRAAASEGIGVLLVSIEPTDLAEVCDRILVHRNGGLTALGRSTPDEVLDAIYSTQLTGRR